jgi:hypothetical protein
MLQHLQGQGQGSLDTNTQLLHPHPPKCAAEIDIIVHGGLNFCGVQYWNNREPLLSVLSYRPPLSFSSPFLIASEDPENNSFDLFLELMEVP